MVYVAIKTFSGAIKMRKGEERELTTEQAAPLLRAGYIKKIPQPKKKEG